VPVAYSHAENNETGKYKQIVALELLNVSHHTFRDWGNGLRNFELAEVEEFCPWLYTFSGFGNPFSGIYIR
jgi:hypothetical protein